VIFRRDRYDDGEEEERGEVLKNAQEVREGEGLDRGLIQ